MTFKLKNCPFCGGSDQKHLRAMGENWVLCSCGASGGVRSGDNNEGLNHWNTRAALSEPVVDVEALKEELYALLHETSSPVIEKLKQRHYVVKIVNYIAAQGRLRGVQPVPSDKERAQAFDALEIREDLGRDIEASPADILGSVHTETIKRALAIPDQSETIKALVEIYDAAIKVCFLGRTSGGVEGRDGELCDGLGVLEALLEKYSALALAKKGGA